MDRRQKFQLAGTLSYGIFIIGLIWSAERYFMEVMPNKEYYAFGISANVLSYVLDEFELFSAQEVLLFVIMAICITGLLLTILYSCINKRAEPVPPSSPENSTKTD